MIRFLVALLTAALHAQVARLANYAPQPYVGWTRATIDTMPAARDGVLYAKLPGGGYSSSIVEASYRVGRQVGRDCWTVDVRCALAAGEERAYDLATFTAMTVPAPRLPDDLVAHFGWFPRVNGGDLFPVSPPIVDGAAIMAHLRARVPGTRLLVCDLWVRWYEGHPSWHWAEALLTASNPQVADLHETTAQPIVLTWADALVRPIGALGGVLAPAGTTWTDGQSRLIPLGIVWPRFLGPQGSPQQAMQAAWATAGSDFGVLGVGCASVLPQGQPRLPGAFQVRPWAASRWVESGRRLHTWGPGLLGIAPLSGQTGPQEDQVFPCGEPLLPGGVGALQIRYLAAAKWSNRPCHHREADGSPLRPALHTARPLIFWDGRPHGQLWSLVDRLGKSGPIAAWDVIGEWYGPDVEHWLIGGLAGAARLTGSSALQSLLSAQANLYPLQWTTTAGWSTSSPFAARAVGYEGMNAVRLWHDLEDRTQATATRAHWLARWDRVLRAGLTKPRDVWDPRENDPRLGTGWWWSPWQQALGAYGLDLAGETFGVAEARTMALAAAKRVLADAIAREGGSGKWRTFSAVSLDGTQRFTGQESNIFWLFGTPLAVAVVLRHEPQHATARAIRDQMRSDATMTTQTSWLAPEVWQ